MGAAPDSRRRGFPGGFAVAGLKTAGAVLLLAVTCLAAAGTLRLSAGSSPDARFTVEFADQRVAGGRSGLGLRGPSPLELGVHLRRTAGMGLLGNVIVDFDGTISTAGQARAAIAGRATAGPVALRLHGEAASAAGLWFLRGEQAAASGFLREAGWQVGAGATWRVQRNVLLLADPSFVRGSAGSRLFLPVEVRLPRTLGDHELRFRLEGSFAGAGSGPRWVAAGAGVRLDRGRAAPWEAWLLAGGRNGMFSPGLSLNVQEKAGPGIIAFALALEPWRAPGGHAL
ncbi:MAG TPA: hypothetical protein VK092_07960, partial [Deinococcales bacterium]|nr:hypothetical protein [Deinococcales bacterium]